ncbi:MAG: hypothetical protein V1773_01990 [bacterium]
MKTFRFTSTDIVKGLFVAALLFFSVTLTNAQTTKKLTRYQTGVENLKMALDSENTGLRKSAYELLGKLKYPELIPCLLNNAATEEDMNLQFVLALTLLDYNTVETKEMAENILNNNKYVLLLSDIKTNNSNTIDK